MRYAHSFLLEQLHLALLQVNTVSHIRLYSGNNNKMWWPRKKYGLWKIGSVVGAKLKTVCNNYSRRLSIGGSGNMPQGIFKDWWDCILMQALMQILICIVECVGLLKFPHPVSKKAIFLENAWAVLRSGEQAESVLHFRQLLAYVALCRQTVLSS